MNTYTYYFRSRPDLTRPLPAQCSTVLVHREPEWEPLLECEVYGYVRCSRRLPTADMAEHGLVDDPRNILAGVMLE